jgi:multiple sugar transport system ATP-binding protein
MTDGLVLDRLTRRVGDRVVLDALSLRVEPGECVALLGPSGCGKTTTLRLVAGLDDASGGRIDLDGVDITRLPPGRRRVAMVFQSYALYPHLSVTDNLALGLRVRGVPATERHRRITSVLELLQLTELRHRKPAQISGGQRQRVALARALLREPEIMLLDEPMSNLDAQLREDLRPELRRLLCGGRHPVLYVTHDQQEAMGIADRVALLEDGILRQVGTPRRIYEEPANRFAASFLGRPAINLLLMEGGRQLGLRPEHLRPAREEGLPARVVRREWWGHEPLVWVSTERGELRMLLAPGADVPDPLRVTWRPEQELWFDAASGERLP